MGERIQRSGNIHQESRWLAESVKAIRRASGKPNPSDFPVGSAAWRSAAEDFVLDVQRVMEATDGH